MRKRAKWILALSACLALAMGSAEALPRKGEPAPSFAAVDINGKPVNLDEVIQANSDTMVILFFFSVEHGEVIARKLRSLHAMYGVEGPHKKVDVIGIGYQEDEPALKAFAEELHIQYYVVEDKQDARILEGYGPIQTIPITFMIDRDKLVLSVLRGSGEGEAQILARIAENYLTKNPEVATGIADSAKAEGEDAAVAGEVKGYALAFTGKLDEAEGEFSAIDSKMGLAHVALERGDNAKAIELAGQAGDSGYAKTVEGYAYMRSGKLEDAEKAFGAATEKEAAEWQASRAMNGMGRIEHQQGDGMSATAYYQQASSLDKYNIVALSNEGALYREAGQPEMAAKVLEKAQTRAKDDPLVGVMLQQVLDELQAKNDNERRERIRQRIKDLGARYREMKEAGTAEPVDPWTTRPMVMAFLPSENGGGYFFERAGLDLALRREVEIRLGQSDRITVVERELIDELLQELELGSSELADSDTQLRLGRILAARLFGFVDFAPVGDEMRMFVRLINTETTDIAGQYSVTVPQDPDVDALVEEVLKSVTDTVAATEPLQGLVAQANANDDVVINLGTLHGVQPGMQFHVIAEGAPIEVGGKTRPGKPELVGKLEIVSVDTEYLSTCKVLELKEGLALATDMKLKAAAQ